MNPSCAGPWTVVVDGRLVADGEVQVFVELVAERESDADVVELAPCTPLMVARRRVAQEASRAPHKCS